MTIKIITILGARPQLIKTSAISNLIKKSSKIKEIIIHTGQHYNYEMSDVFFKELKIPKPKYNLNIKSKYHGEMTARMIQGIEKILIKEKPDYTIVYGDTNSTLAGTIASKKLLIPIVHIESGLRSYNKKMPEETNRVLTDHCSDILFTPSKLANLNLKKENINKDSIYQVGDIMYDIFLNHFKKLKKNNNFISSDILVTIHRPENTDNFNKLLNIIKNLNELSKKYKVLFPIHPRTKKKLIQFNIFKLIDDRVKITKPLAYKEMISHLKYCKLLITDSGGLQKEAFFSKTQVITVRDQTEWPETIEAGWNRLVKPNSFSIYKNALKFISKKGLNKKPYGNGNAAKLIISTIIKLHHPKIS